ncbi:hypothetical protein L6164_000676 [Bauhinia variegata]|uniref:Uncharacterized protein n=1 Tax=Bauhinia variegata TaxID=167791 RepID=A0ACB9Q9X3_BAUVA|nr:hypothetical protein L6164_000676 [Bauhinia variegata]
MTEQGGKLKAMDGNVSAAAGDETNWWWALSSASLFGWGIASFAKGYSGDSRLMPLKAFGVASASVVVLQYYGIRKVNDALRTEPLLIIAFVECVLFGHQQHKTETPTTQQSGEGIAEQLERAEYPGIQVFSLLSKFNTGERFSAALCDSCRLGCSSMGSESPVTNPTKFAGPDFLCHRIINISEIEPFLPSDCCIYKVPINLRQVNENEKAYTPLLISIGPLHHGKEEFSKMEKQKEMYFQFFSKRLPKQDLEAYEAYLGDEETQIRSCYSEKHDDIKKQDFVRMILLDSVFVMELFLRNLKSKKEVENDCIFTKPWISKTIQRDMLLLENQLPIIVLKKLYSFVPGGEKGGYGNFLDLAHLYFESFDPMKSTEEAVRDDAKNNHRTNACCELFRHENPQRQDKNLKNWKELIHFTDLIRYLYLPSKFEVKTSQDVLRNAMKLNEAGIGFEKFTDGNVSAAAGDGTNWWWALSSASLFGWGIASFAEGYSGDSRLMPVKAFGVASLFVGSAASVPVVVLQYYGIRKVNDALRTEPLLIIAFVEWQANAREAWVNEKAYTPLLISIGPLHHGKKEFSKMEKQKQMYFQFFLERLPEQHIKIYEEYLKDEETQIRSCYSDKHDDDIKKPDFVSMILLDSVFIMELFLRNLRSKEEVENDRIFTKPWISKTIQRDLLLLENQLPIFVLEKLYNSVVPEGEKGRYGNFFDLAHNYFESFHPMKSSEEAGRDDAKNNHRTSSEPELRHPENPQRQDENLKDWKNSIHFTDLIRYLYLPIDLEVKPSLDVLRNKSSLDVLRNAMKLNEAGITFEKLTDTDTRLLDIKFKKERFSYFHCLSCLPYFTYFKARFQIPQLKVDHTTECVLRNLIAFEQCHYPETPYICNYVSLIDSLIHTTGDVELLVEKQVLVHQLGSHKELATLVNGLCRHVVTNGTCYSKIISELNQHYEIIWNRSMAALRLVYFRDPWRSSSTLVGIVIVVFAVFQFCRVIRSIFGHK